MRHLSPFVRPWRAIALTLLALAAALPTGAEGWAWRELTPTEGPAPEPRRDGTAIYDPIGQRVIVFGGQGASGHLNDVWAFDLLTRTWGRLETKGTPPSPRLGHDAVYDPQGHQMIVWAGQNEARFFNDTWSLDLQTLTWRDVSPDARPQARYGSAAIFDPIERRLVQFAGFTDISQRFQDTQAFDLDTNTWEDLTPPGDKPEVRCLLTAAFDAAARRMIVYGGQRSGPLDDIWAFDLGNRSWTPLTPQSRPPGRFFAASFIDPRRRFVVVGGATAAGDVGEAWSFDLATGQWSRVEIPPIPPRQALMGSYVDDRGSFIVFGGASGSTFLGDVWELMPVP